MSDVVKKTNGPFLLVNKYLVSHPEVEKKNDPQKKIKKLKRELETMDNCVRAIVMVIENMLPHLPKEHAKDLCVYLTILHSLFGEEVHTLEPFKTIESQQRWIKHHLAIAVMEGFNMNKDRTE